MTELDEEKRREYLARKAARERERKVSISTPEYKAAEAARKREYRRKMKEQGTPVPRGGRTSRKAEDSYFIAWDGEGADFGELDHRYILLMYATSTGETGYISNSNGLDWLQSLSFIMDVQSRHPNAINVVFSAVYDFTMILRSLFKSQEQLAEFWNINAGRVKDKRGYRIKHGREMYYIRYMPRKQLLVVRYGPLLLNATTGNKERERLGSCNLWDVWGFFQTSFIKAIVKHLGPEYPALDMIKSQKARRSDFKPDDIDNLIPYCRAEVIALAEIMERFRESLQSAGLNVSRWDGAGAIARVMLDREGVKDHHGEIPVDVAEASRYAYAGGRNEIVRFGLHPEKIYHYDINSAYPSGMLELPSLSQGEWFYTDRYERWQDEHFSLYHIVWELKAGHGIYPFFHRSKKTGQISYPFNGAGWYWGPEVWAYLDNADKYDKGYVSVVGVWSFVQNGNVKPFSFISDYYSKRQQWVKEKNGAEYAMKLGLNSLYGKCAQQVGAKDGQPPKHYQLQWAGYITSLARAKIYDAMMSQPHSIIMVATDGIYSVLPLALEVSDKKELGKWEYKEHEQCLAVQSGVYWLMKDGKWEGHHRGFNEEMKDSALGLSPERILKAWDEGFTELSVSAPRSFVSFGLPANKMTSMANLGQWIGGEKQLDIINVSAKRKTPKDAKPLEGLVHLRAGWSLPIDMFPGMPRSQRETNLINFGHSSPHKSNFDTDVRVKILIGGKPLDLDSITAAKLIDEGLFSAHD